MRVGTSFSESEQRPSSLDPVKAWCATLTCLLGVGMLGGYNGLAVECAERSLGVPRKAWCATLFLFDWCCYDSMLQWGCCRMCDKELGSCESLVRDLVPVAADAATCCCHVRSGVCSDAATSCLATCKAPGAPRRPARHLPPAVLVLLDPVVLPRIGVGGGAETRGRGNWAPASGSWERGR